MSTLDWVLPRTHRRSEPGRHDRRVAWPVGVLFVLVTAWEIGVRAAEIPSYVLPPPSAVILALAENHPTIWAELTVSLSAFFIAFGLTVVTGYLLALVMYQWEVLEMIVYPYVITARAIPIVALIPIFIIWFGFGFASIVAISYLISVFAMVVNSLAGFKSTDEEVIEMLHSFSATNWDLFRHVHLYASLPLVLAGMKICVILTFTGVIVGEFLIGGGGIGFLILEYRNGLATAKMFAGILTVSAVQLLLFGGVVFAEKAFVRWR